jgi:hypothetical protein
MIVKHSSQHTNFVSQVQSFIPTQSTVEKKKYCTKVAVFILQDSENFLLQMQHHSSAILQRNLKRSCAFSRQTVKGLNKEFYFTVATGLLKIDLKCASSQASSQARHWSSNHYQSLHMRGILKASLGC